MNFFTTERTETTENFTEDINVLSGRVVDCAIQVHRKLGPGLLESAYQHGLIYLFVKSGIPFEKEKTISIQIDDYPIDAGYREDEVMIFKIFSVKSSVFSVHSVVKN